MADNKPKKIKGSKKQRQLTPQELGMHEMHQVYQQLMSLMDEAFGESDELDEDEMTYHQQHTINDIMSLESEWILDPIKRAELSVIQFDNDDVEDNDQ